MPPWQVSKSLPVQPPCPAEKIRFPCMMMSPMRVAVGCTCKLNAVPGWAVADLLPAPLVAKRATHKVVAASAPQANLIHVHQADRHLEKKAPTSGAGEATGRRGGPLVVVPRRSERPPQVPGDQLAGEDELVGHGRTIGGRAVSLRPPRSRVSNKAHTHQSHGPTSASGPSRWASRYATSNQHVSCR